MAPSEHERYRPGTSWTEETGMSLNEFRSAFDSIGYRHSSKAGFMATEDKFLGRMYASYVDKKTNLTYYFRNHPLVDRYLDELVARLQVQSNSKHSAQAVDFKADANSASPVDAKSRSPGDMGSASPGDLVSQSPEIPKPDLQEMQSTDLPTTETTIVDLHRKLTHLAA